MKATPLHREYAPNPSRRGFTLAELIVGTAFAGMLTAAVISAFIFVLRTSYGVGNYVEMNSQSRIAVEQFARDVRMAREVTSLASTSMTLRLPESVDITYTYVSGQNGGEFRRTGPDGERSVLSDVESVEIRYFNLHGDETESLTDAKIIQLDAEMVRRVLQLEHTNHLISARFTLRNKDVSN